MIYYAKLSLNKQRSDVVNSFLKVYVPENWIILDDTSIQKQEGSLYYEVKDQLILQKESLMIDSFSSLGKNNREIYKELIWLYAHRIPLIILDLPSTILLKNPLPLNKIVLEVYATLADKEIQNIKTGQQHGIQNARKQGKQLGRTKIDYPMNWDKLYRQWITGDISSKEFLKQSGLKKGTFYNLLKEYKSTEAHQESHLA